MSTPDSDIVDHLDSNLAALTKGTNLFIGPVREPDGNVPGKAVFCLLLPGSSPGAFIGQSTCNHVRLVQIRVRSDKDDFSGGQTLAKSIVSTAHYADLSGYYDVRVRESDPNYLGIDGSGYHEWSINTDFYIVE